MRIIRWAACLLAVGCFAGCHTALEDNNSAIKALSRDKPLEREPEMPASQVAQACLVTARDLERGGHDAEAIQLYERARGYNPKLTRATHRLAVLYERNGKIAEAVAEYQKGLEQTPKDAELLNDFGYFELTRGNLEEAEKLLRAAVAQKPKHQRAWGNLGLVLAQREKYKESYEAFVSASTPAEAHSNLGMILAQQQRLESARAELEEALRLNPELAAPRRVLAWLDEHKNAPPIVATVAGPATPNSAAR